MACLVPMVEALESIWLGAERVVTVSEDEIEAAMRHLFSDTHNVAEGAGAAPLAGTAQGAQPHAGQTYRPDPLRWQCGPRGVSQMEAYLWHASWARNAQLLLKPDPPTRSWSRDPS